MMVRPTSIRDEIRYGYAVGRVRVLEGRLLGRSTFERLVDAADLREQKRILAETHVGRYLDGAETAEDVEIGLEASLADLYDEFLTRADLPSAVVRYFQALHDYANLRLAVKARVLGSGAGRLSSLGGVPSEAFAADGAGLPAEMRALLTAWDGVEQAPALDDVEATIDRALFDALSAAAKDSRLRFLRGLTRLRIDLANARLLIRARSKALQPAEIVSRLVPGGSTALERLAERAPRMSVAELADAIADSGVLGGVPEEDLADVRRFDIAADAAVAARMLEARMAAGGADPVLAYVLGREAEVLLLRTAVVGRLAGLDRESVRERIRERLS
ncbi:MAG: V-type ATPase subunit [Coriobacteriia bacterium]